MPAPDRGSRKRTYAMVFAVLAAIGFGIYSVWSPAGLQLYTSPVIRVKGKSIRLQVLKPVGWYADDTISVRNAQQTDYSVMLREPASGVGLSSNFKTIFGIEHHEPGYVSLTVPLSPVDKFDGIYIQQPDLATCCLTGDPGGVLQYVCKDKEQFDSTYKLVCKSFKIISD